MKQILLSTILALISLQSHAKNMEGSYSFLIGDDITKQVVEYAPDEVSFANMVWDLRELSDLDKKHKVVYEQIRMSPDLHNHQIDTVIKKIEEEQKK